mmetsp:Transcript_16692/g.47919  ORF Transcript_16692/g.47919 Transcript_16692/m.47919 type:complete len:210 (-) Transcript_16692:2131-2760(-)
MPPTCPRVIPRSSPPRIMASTGRAISIASSTSAARRAVATRASSRSWPACRARSPSAPSSTCSGRRTAAPSPLSTCTSATRTSAIGSGSASSSLGGFPTTRRRSSTFSSGCALPTPSRTSSPTSLIPPSDSAWTAERPSSPPSRMASTGPPSSALTASSLVCRTEAVSTFWPTLCASPCRSSSPSSRARITTSMPTPRPRVGSGASAAT